MMLSIRYFCVLLSLIVVYTHSQTTISSTTNLYQNRTVYRQPVNRYTGIGRYNSGTNGRYTAGSDGRYRGSDGRYVADNSGRYSNSDGRYMPDNAGRYVHIDPGYKHTNDNIDPYRHNKDKIPGYVHQNQAGGYRPDNNDGRYVHVDPGYQHQKDVIDPYKHQNDKIDPYEHEKDSQLVAATPASRNLIGKITGNYSPITAATLPTVTLKRVSEDVSNIYNNRNHSIIFDNREINADSYDYTYKVTNTIHAAERGSLVTGKDGNETIATNGFYEYVGPDAVLYRVEYKSGDDGFQPVAAHLPTPPPTPDYILRALEWQRANGFLKDDE